MEEVNLVEEIFDLLSSSGFGLLVSALIGAVAGYFASRATKKQRETDINLAAEQATGQELTNQHAEFENLKLLWQANIDALSTQVSFLEKKIADLTHEISYLQVLVGDLETEIITLGGDPARIRASVRREAMGKQTFIDFE